MKTALAILLLTASAMAQSAPKPDTSSTTLSGPTTVIQTAVKIIAPPCGGWGAAYLSDGTCRIILTLHDGPENAKCIFRPNDAGTGFEIVCTWKPEERHP